MYCIVGNLGKLIDQLKRLLIVSTNSNGFSLAITDDPPNFPAIQYLQMRHFTIYTTIQLMELFSYPQSWSLI